MQEKTIETTYRSPPETLIKYDQYLAFTNEDMAREIANSKALEQTVFGNILDNCDLARSDLKEKEVFQTSIIRGSRL